MDRSRLIAVSLTVVLALTLSAFAFAAHPNSNMASTSLNLNVKGEVTVVHIRDGVVLFKETSSNLITNAGKDFIAQQLGSTSPASNGANYIALSTDSTTPSASDTTLAGEITTGGLQRQQGTYSHTAGTNTFTVQKTFTASASFTGVQKAGLFTASAGGTMMAENTFSAVNLISGDQLQITWTITIS
ncbi:MAG: hypothetical protein QW158_07840 [Nitrososphaerales archaeon]